MERSTVVLDASSLKALAHPLRVRLLGMLRADGPSTATALGGRVGESSGTTSYHLRQLAAAGLVVDDPERGNARERWWRAGQDSTRLEAAAWIDDPAVRPALDTYLSAVMTSYASRMQQYLDEQDSWPRRWNRAATLSDWRLSLTAAELTRLNDEVERLVESYVRPPRKGDERVAVQWQGFPVHPASDR
jgi:DNA-binding transcriptional ArsR family regulator